MTAVTSDTVPDYDVLCNNVNDSPTPRSADDISTTSSSVFDDQNLDNYLKRGRPRSRSLYNSSRPLVYITRRVPQRGLDVLLPTCNLSQWDSEEAVPRGELVQSVQGVHAILCQPSDVIDAQILDAAGPNLRVVATMSEGTDHIDMEECARRGIRVLNCPPPDVDAQADLAVALILLTLRSVADGLQFDTMIHESSCDLSSPAHGKNVDVISAWWNSLIQRKTLGVYGLTPLGLAVASRLRQLGANDIILADFNRTSREQQDPMANGLGIEHDAGVMKFQIVDREQFLARADIICVCDAQAPKQSIAIFDENAFRSMKTGAILVTSGSGDALDYLALYEALRDGQICAAGLNTCNQMPVPFRYPLQGLSNCVFMPQTQESAFDLRHKTSVVMATNLLAALNEPQKTG